MREKLRALCAQYDMLPAGARILCAVSGGADSMCMLHLLHALAPERGFTVHAAHFNHRLRGEESQRDEEFVRAWCRRNGIPFLSGGADVAAEAAQRGRGIEETARLLRYEFLERAAEGCGASRIATAHTANDNAETLLLHLVRGAGLQGLSGIPPRRGNIVRPLLGVTRAEVEEYCARNGVAYVEDSTNRDEAYARNYLRLRVMPLLEQMNPHAAESLSAAARRLREDHEYLTDRTRALCGQSQLTPEGLSIPVELLNSQPPAIANRAARLLLEQAGGGQNCTAAHIEAVLSLCRSSAPSAQADLPALHVRRVYDRLILSPKKPPAAPPQRTPLFEDGVTVYGDTGWSVLCRPARCPEEGGKNSDSFFLSRDKIRGSLILRPRQTGDQISLAGRPRKSLKKLFIDEKLPLRQRELLPVLADDSGVLAAASFGPDVSRLAAPGEPSLQIIFQKE